jgi:outer membrane protein assembly factor BamB
LGVRQGVCVVLGLPKADQGGFVTDLVKASQLVVYFQSPHGDEVAAVRKSAEEAHLLGSRIFADRGAWDSLHLADNLADAILVAPAAHGAVSRDELLRVLHPQGRAVFSGRDGSAGAVIVKPFPQGIDDWSYPHHGPDNNPQSADRTARAPYMTQFLAEPKFCPSPAVTVAAGGRLFRACGHLAHQANQNAMLNTLLAVNAYNGTILWKRPLSEGFMVMRNTIIATPETLYLADDRSCKLLDAATGELRGEITSPDPAVDGTVWKWMALDKGILFALLGGEEFKAPVLRSDGTGLGSWPRANWPGFDYPEPRTAWAQGRTLVAIDVTTRKLLWRHREQDLVDGRAVCMAKGRIYFLSPERFLACLKADTGQVVWRTTDPELLKGIGPLFAKQPTWTGLSPFPYVKCNDKFLFFSGPRIPRVVAVSAADGRLLWRKEVPMSDGGSVHLLLRDDALYAVGESAPDAAYRIEYETGRVLSRFLGRRGCTIATGTVDSIFYRAPEGTVRFDLATASPKHIAPVRPPCYEGVIVADGLLHWGAWKCSCPLSLYGHVCLAPAGDFAKRSATGPARLEPGPGDVAKVQAFPVLPGDWPTYLGDNARSGVTQVFLPKRVARRWTYGLPRGVRPTAPIVAGGVVFFGDDRGVVHAVGADDGSVRWRAHTAGAIFFPPALWQGRLYAGSADGRVYCFEAATGRLLWRFRVAPAERWIPVYGKLMSTWPVAGGVVVADGVVYAAAGIAHYDGTYVYALDAASGQVKWCNDSSGRLSREVDCGISLQGNLYVADGELQFAGGSKYETARYDLKTGQCLNRPDHSVVSRFRTAFYPYYPEYGRYLSLAHTLPDGSALVYQASYDGSRHTALTLLAGAKPGTAGTGKPETRSPLAPGETAKRPAVWTDKSGRRYNALIVASGAILAAGHRGSGANEAASLTAIDIAKGATLWEIALPAAAVRAGAAVDHQGRIVVASENGQILAFAGE